MRVDLGAGHISHLFRAATWVKARVWVVPPAAVQVVILGELLDMTIEDGTR